MDADKVADREIDELTGTPTTGHSWDGIKELDTPMPRWWLWTFYGCILFAIVYVILYPAIPMVTRATSGVLGWSSRAELRTEIADTQAAQAVFGDKIAAASMDQIVADPDLFQFAARAGRSAFLVNCVQCHGAGAQGSVGFPNLQDDDWLWGGTPEQIRFTIAHGIRSDDPDTHASLMPAFGHDGILKADQIVNVSAYVMTLSGLTPRFGITAEGRTVFADNCASCHGAGGEGNQTLGAPSLKDAIWLRSPDQNAIIAQITNPKMGIMPAWEPRLGPVAVKELAAYVYSLGGGTQTAGTN
jgi:cytochrome c oxidase cbb3-type subunit 3